MTEIKKGTPVWVWDRDKERKRRATFLFYDDVSPKGTFRYIALEDKGISACWYMNAEPINETNDQALQLIAEAKLKIAEAEKILNAQ